MNSSTTNTSCDIITHAIRLITTPTTTPTTTTTTTRTTTPTTTHTTTASRFSKPHHVGEKIDLYTGSVRKYTEDLIENTVYIFPDGTKVVIVFYLSWTTKQILISFFNDRIRRGWGVCNTFMIQSPDNTREKYVYYQSTKGNIKPMILERSNGTNGILTIKKNLHGVSILYIKDP